MKYRGKITDNKDLVTKEYVDNATPAPATRQQIEERAVSNPIAPVNLDAAVASSLASTEEELSTIQKQHAHEFLGNIPFSYTLSDGSKVIYNFVCHETVPSN